jgi:hypothetical protein
MQGEAVHILVRSVTQAARGRPVTAASRPKETQVSPSELPMEEFGGSRHRTQPQAQNPASCVYGVSRAAFGGEELPPKEAVWLSPGTRWFAKTTSARKQT